MRAKHSTKPMYKLVYHVDLSELMANRTKYTNCQGLPIDKIQNVVTNQETIVTDERKGKILTTIACPRYHVRAIIKYAYKFDEGHPCTILEYRQIMPETNTEKWIARVLPNGGFVVNDKKDIPDLAMFTDCEHQVKKRHSHIFPQCVKR